MHTPHDDRSTGRTFSIMGGRDGLVPPTSRRGTARPTLSDAAAGAAERVEKVRPVLLIATYTSYKLFAREK